MHQSKDGGLDDKALPRGGQSGRITDAIVTVEPGTCMVFDPNTTNAYIMDGDSNNANAIWLRNWREVGLENARRPAAGAFKCWWLVDRARCRGRRRAWRGVRASRSSSYTSTRSVLDGAGNIEPYLKALLEAMKTKPKAVERTVTYYPEAVEVKGSVKRDEN